MKNVGERKAQNSRIEKVKIKLQAAMEYLMTYGWAILIIALALGVLYSFGILSPETLKPQICSLSPPFYCSDQYLTTNGFLTLKIAQGSGSTVKINKIACVDKSLLNKNGLPSNPSYWSSNIGSVYIPSGSQQTVGGVICYSSSGNQYNGKIGSVFSGAIIANVTFTSTNVNILSVGEITAPVKDLVVVCCSATEGNACTATCPSGMKIVQVRYVKYGHDACKNLGACNSLVGADCANKPNCIGNSSCTWTFNNGNCGDTCLGYGKVGYLTVVCSS